MATEPRTRSKTGLRNAQREETRAAVLKVAATLFAQHGFRGVAVADVANMSGIRKPNLLYHFASKEALWKETVDWVFAEADADFAATQITPGLDRWQTFRQLVTAYYDVCRRHPAYVLIPMVEGVAASWRTEWIAERHLRRHTRNFEGYIKVLIADGLLPSVDPLHLQNMLTGGAQLSLGLAPLWEAAIGAETTSEAFIDGYAQTVLSLLQATHPV